MPIYTYAKLTEEQLGKVRAFEEETDKRILALRSYNMQPDELSEEELEKLQALEAELGYVILAVK
ncbi:MAG: hypothetical protein U9R48_02790 [Chloroflexota bacterium]|nr:hypothetical protein [Chloroflexota bacterium]